MKRERYTAASAMCAREIENNIFEIKFELSASCISYLSTNSHC